MVPAVTPVRVPPLGAAGAPGAAGPALAPPPPPVGPEPAEAPPVPLPAAAAVAALPVSAGTPRADVVDADEVVPDRRWRAAGPDVTVTAGSEPGGVTGNAPSGAVLVSPETAAVAEVSGDPNAAASTTSPVPAGRGSTGDKRDAVRSHGGVAVPADLAGAGGAGQGEQDHESECLGSHSASPSCGEVDRYRGDGRLEMPAEIRGGDPLVVEQVGSGAREPERSPVRGRRPGRRSQGWPGRSARREGSTARRHPGGPAPRTSSRSSSGRGRATPRRP